MDHMLTCLSTKFNGGLLRLHEADGDADNWLDSMVMTAFAKRMNEFETLGWVTVTASGRQKNYISKMPLEYCHGVVCT